jgi:DnaJ-class molecular chaperone
MPTTSQLDKAHALAERLGGWHNGEFSPGGIPVSQIAERYGTPFYLYHGEMISERVRRVRAALGGDVEVETLDGRELLHIEPGTAPGTVLRLRGQGVPNLNRRGRGDLFVTINVTVPTDLSREERRLLEELSELRNERSSRRHPSRAELRRPE